MTTMEELANFVKEALAHGQSRDQIENALLEAGWERSYIKSALNNFAEIEFPIPVPKPKVYLSAREAFFYLILFTTLYISAFNLGHLLFQFIDLGFVNPAMPINYRVWQESTRFSVSSLIIAFPLFLYTSYILGREIKQDPNKQTSKIRKWLTYATLFIAACVIIGDLTSLVYNLLSGEIQIRFLLKALTIGLISGAVFIYYLFELRQEGSMES